jgi:hypothetical protein
MGPPSTKFRTRIRSRIWAVTKATDLGNVLRHGFGKSSLEGEETLWLFLSHRCGKCLDHGYGKRFSPYKDGLMKVIFVSSMKVFLGSGFGK